MWSGQLTVTFRSNVQMQIWKDLLESRDANIMLKLVTAFRNEVCAALMYVFCYLVRNCSSNLFMGCDQKYSASGESFPNDE